MPRPARDSLELCDNLLKPREDTGAISSPDDAALTDRAMEGAQGLVFEEFDRNLDRILSFRTPDSVILETLIADDVGQGACLFVEGQFLKKTLQWLIICIPASDKGKSAGA